VYITTEVQLLVTKYSSKSFALQTHKDDKNGNMQKRHTKNLKTFVPASKYCKITNHDHFQH